MGITSLGIRLWQSPSTMAWAALSARAITFVTILPLVLKLFSPQEVALWLAIGAVVAMQPLFELGFAQTFVRVIAYAAPREGETHQQIASSPQDVNLQSKYEFDGLTMPSILETMRKIYLVMAIFALVTLATGGTAFMSTFVLATADTTYNWLAWAIVTVSFSISLWANQYNILLTGVQRIPLVKRCEASVAVGSIISGSIGLVAGCNLLMLVAIFQVWNGIGAILCRYYALRELKIMGMDYLEWKIDKKIIQIVFPPAWRSFLGILLSFGTLQISALYIAKSSTVAEAASLLLSLRLIQAISQFSQVPLYTKLPLLATLYARKLPKELVSAAESGMRQSYSVFVFGSVVTAVAFPYFLTRLSSDIAFVSTQFWALLCLAFFAERIGGMHSQLIGVTNRINWHVLNGFTGVIFLGGLILMYGEQGVLAYPLSILLANVGFFMWVSARQSYAKFHMSFPHFEIKTSVFPGCVLVVGLLFSALVR